MKHLLTALLMLLGLVAQPAWAQPAQAKIHWQWQAQSAAPAPSPGSVFHTALKIRLEDHFHVQSNKPLDEYTIPTTLEVKAPEGLAVKEIVWPKSVPFEVGGEKASVFEEEFSIGVAFEIGESVAPGSYPVQAVMEYQACNDVVCLAPAKLEMTINIQIGGDGAMSASNAITSPPVNDDDAATQTATPAPASNAGCNVITELDAFSVQGAGGGYRSASEFIEFLDSVESGTINDNPFKDMGALAIVGVVILGGIALNLTPCVLPLIPINLAILGAGTQAGSRGRGFALGGVFGLAMAVAYGILGLIVILTASNFGEINQNIWFNVAIAALFVVLALAMFDIIHIDFSKLQGKINVTGFGKQGSFILAFGMGAVSAILAGACVAPLLIAVIAYSSTEYAQGNLVALTLPFFLGLGMALPWPFLGAGLSLMPKPGMWMVRVKQALGVFILLMAGYYGYLAYEIWDATRERPGQGPAAADMEGGWTSDICAGLARAKAEGKPVFIDMWATWCKNCLVMDRTTFKDEAVLARLENYVKIKFQAEDLNASPAREMLKKFDGIGLPTYAVLNPPQ